jgi:hypothetical protein
MDLDTFVVGRTARFANATELELGTVTVPSGRLRVRDSFAPPPNEHDGCLLLVPPGSHRVWVTVIQFESDPLGGFPAEREAYLSMALTDGAPARLDYADALVAPPRPTYGALTGTDSAHVALFDDTVAEITPARLGDELDATDPLPAGYANLDLGTGLNVIASHTGFGDGAFPILATFTAAGDPVAIHVDFGVVARSDDDDEDL